MFSIYPSAPMHRLLLEHFAFDLYDTDNSGHIDLEEAQFMIKDIYGEEFEHNVFAKRAHQKLAELELEKIDFPVFSEFSHTHRAMLYPAFALQMNLKKYIMGAKFWHRQAINRLKISNGKYKTVTDIIGKENFHKHRKLHKRNSDLINMWVKLQSACVFNATYIILRQHFLPCLKQYGHLKKMIYKCLNIYSVLFRFRRASKQLSEQDMFSVPGAAG